MNSFWWGMAVGAAGVVLLPVVGAVIACALFRGARRMERREEAERDEARGSFVVKG